MTQFDLFYYWPVIQWDFWIGLVAILGAVGFNCAVAHAVSMKPAEILSELGYGQANKDSAWPVLVMVFRYLAAYKVVVAAFGLYYWYTLSMRYSIWFMFCLELPTVLLIAYRAYKEDEKNGMCSKMSKENAKNTLKKHGAQVGALALAGTFLWFEFYNGTNYVKDAKHGLPEEFTMMLGVVKNKFLKGH